MKMFKKKLVEKYPLVVPNIAIAGISPSSIGNTSTQSVSIFQPAMLVYRSVIRFMFLLGFGTFPPPFTPFKSTKPTKSSKRLCSTLCSNIAPGAANIQKLVAAPPAKVLFLLLMIAKKPAKAKPTFFSKKRGQLWLVISSASQKVD